MENPQTLIEWASKFGRELNIGLIEYSWPKENNLPITDVQITIPHGRAEYKGRGTSFSKEAAYNSAIAEALERIALNHNNISNSNGLAAHTIEARAIENAQNELQERHDFIHSFTNCLRPTLIDSINYTDSELNKSLQVIKKLGADLKWGSIPSSSGHTVICAITGKNHSPEFGVIIGLAHVSYSENQTQALMHLMKKSFCESARNFFAFRYNPECISLEKFLSITNPKTIDHLHLSLDIDYFRKVEPYFSFTEISQTNPAQESIKKLSFSSAKISNSFFPLKLPEIAGLKELQNMGFSIFQAKNKNALEPFINYEYSIPHPLA